MWTAAERRQATARGAATDSLVDRGQAEHRPGWRRNRQTTSHVPLVLGRFCAMTERRCIGAARWDTMAKWSET